MIGLLLGATAAGAVGYLVGKKGKDIEKKAKAKMKAKKKAKAKAKAEKEKSEKTE